MLKRVELFGFDFIAESNISDVVNDIVNAKSYEKNGRLPFLITPNVDDIVKFSKVENEELRRYFLKSAYILPDGQPIVWTSRFGKSKIAKRLPGSDLLPLLWNATKKQHDYKVLALTSSDKISKALEKEHTGTINYTLPFFSQDNHQIIDEITNHCVDILLSNKVKLVIIGVGFPKQNILAVNIYNKLKEHKIETLPLFCMVGASFEFYLEFKKRAPKFIQDIGLEWAYRFSREPKRLYKRYFIEDIAFISIFFKEIFKKNSPGGITK